MLYSTRREKDVDPNIAQVSGSHKLKSISFYRYMTEGIKRQKMQRYGSRIGKRDKYLG